MSLSSQIQINIATHCHETLEAMKPTEKGFYCSSCNIDVVDFTKMNDDELISFLKHHKFKTPCGRFKEDQLNQPFFIEKPKPFFQFSFIKKMITACFLLPLSFTQTIAQKKVKKQTTEIHQQEKKINVEEKIIIEGKIKNKEFVTEGIEVSIDSFKTITNTKGYFKMELPISMLGNKVTIKCKSKIFSTEEYTITMKQKNYTKLKAYKKQGTYNAVMGRILFHSDPKFYGNSTQEIINYFLLNRGLKP